jgi:undecaprenyl-diphosphatase
VTYPWRLRGNETGRPLFRRCSGKPPYGAEIDFHLYKLLNGYAFHHDAFEDPLRFAALQAQFFFAGLLAVVFLMRGKWRSVSGRHGAVAAGFSALLALGVAQVISHLWERPRPYVGHADAHLFIPASHDPSFPSDHATAAFAIAVALLLRNRRVGIPALVVAVVLSVARVAVGTHYPGDVAAGAVIGTAAALLLWHPRVRRPLHALADWGAAQYEATADRVLRRPATGAT